MSNSRDLHRQAMQLVNAALVLRGNGDIQGYVSKMKQALPLEIEAAESLIEIPNAEPTRSVLLLGAANIAWTCREASIAQRMIRLGLRGNPPISLFDQFVKLLEDISYSLRMEEELNPEKYFYLEALREKAINIRIKSKNDKYAQAVILKYGTHALNKIDASWGAYVESSYVNMFPRDETISNPLAIPTLVRKDAPMLIANVSFKSFGVSLVSDTYLMSQSVDRKQQKWREDLFANFKEDVFEVDYHSSVDRNRILKKFSEEQRRGIYGPIVPLLKESSSFSISLMDKNFNVSTERVLKPLNQSLSLELTPPEPSSPLLDKVLTKAIYFSQPNAKSVKDRDMIDREELNYLEITRKVTNVFCAIGSLSFPSEFEIQIVYDRPYFSIEDERFNLFIQDKEIESVVEKYNIELIRLYDKLALMKAEDFGEEERQQWKRFVNVVRSV